MSLSYCVKKRRKDNSVLQSSDQWYVIRVFVRLRYDNNLSRMPSERLRHISFFRTAVYDKLHIHVKVHIKPSSQVVIDAIDHEV